MILASHICTGKMITCRCLAGCSVSSLTSTFTICLPSAAQVFGVNLTAAISELASIPELNQTLTYFSSPAGIDMLRAAAGNLSAAVVSSLQQAPGDFNLTTGVSRSLCTASEVCSAS